MVEDKIKDILIEQEKQLEVDAILQVMEENELKPTKTSIKNAKNQLINKNKDNYLTLEQKRRDENRKYTETYREEIKKEQERLLEERRKKKRMENAIIAYERHKDEFDIFNPMTIQKSKKGFIEKMKEIFLGRGLNQSKNIEKEVKTKTHKEFEQELREVRHKDFRKEVEEKVNQKEQKLINSKNNKER